MALDEELSMEFKKLTDLNLKKYLLNFLIYMYLDAKNKKKDS